MEKRTLKNHVQYVLIWLLFIWVACLLSIVVDMLLVKLITPITGELSYGVGAIFHAVSMAIGTAIPIAAISYLIAYHLGEFSPAYSFAEGSFALLLHLGVGLLLGFPVWITGGVKWLAGVLCYGTRLHGGAYLDKVTLWHYLLSFLIYALFYLAVKFVAGDLGRRARIRLRIELTGSPIKPTERDRMD